MTRIDYLEEGRTRHEYWESDVLELPEGHRNKKPYYVCYSYGSPCCDLDDEDDFELPPTRKMTDKDKEDLLKAIATHEYEYFTDSDMMGFADERNLSYKEVSHFLAVAFAPEPCKGCKHIAFYASMYPCNVCTRAHDKRDMYEKEEN